MQFRAFENGIEVNGRTIYSTLAGMKNLKISGDTDILGFGIGNDDSTMRTINLDKWYPHEQWLKIFEFIARIYGDTILYNIGYSIPENAEFPEEISTIEDAIRSIDIAYHMNHRKNGKIMYDKSTGAMTEGIGHYGYEKLKDQNLIISECKNPYPCTFDKGILSAMAKRFNPNAIAYHDDSKPCRKNGADSCVYIITW